MSNTQITQADLDELRINNRAPRIVREYLTANEVREALAQEHHIKGTADLQEARNALTQTICDVLGTTRKGVKLPLAHLVLMDGRGVNLTRWEAEQRERVKAGPSKAQRDFHLGIAADIQRGVLAAWEAQR